MQHLSGLWRAAGQSQVGRIATLLHVPTQVERLSLAARFSAETAVGMGGSLPHICRRTQNQVQVRALDQVRHLDRFRLAGVRGLGRPRLAAQVAAILSIWRTLFVSDWLCQTEFREPSQVHCHHSLTCRAMSVLQAVRGLWMSTRKASLHCSCCRLRKRPGSQGLGRESSLQEWPLHRHPHSQYKRAASRESLPRSQRVLHGRRSAAETIAAKMSLTRLTFSYIASATKMESEFRSGHCLAEVPSRRFTSQFP